MFTLDAFPELPVKSVVEPDAENPHVRFDQRGREPPVASRSRSSALTRLHALGRDLGAFKALGKSPSIWFPVPPIGDMGPLMVIS
jgi:hypothetical protein